jgi:phospholipid-translocating ATPase
MLLTAYAGYIVTYVAPLAFVLLITMSKEAYDDYHRYLRDRESNSTKYSVLLPQQSNVSIGEKAHSRSIPSSQVRVGDMVVLEKNQRVPADMVLLHTSEEEGTCFVRTDQLDGETDWKLKVAVGETQSMKEVAVAGIEGSCFGQL